MANHRRWNPVFAEWSIAAASSGNRPWQGQTHGAQTEHIPQHDPGCYLCPGVERAGGKANPAYSGPFAFDNDFSSFGSAEVPHSEALAMTADAAGICRVLCWSERHDQTLASLSKAEFASVIELLIEEYQTLSRRPDVNYVMQFENKGCEVGVSNAHPHGQIYATAYLPDRVRRIDGSMRGHLNEQSLLEQLQDSPSWNSLIVDQSEHFIQWVPWAARFPYETWIFPRKKTSSLAQLNNEQRLDYADFYQRALRRYDALFNRSTPMISVHYNAPSDGQDQSHWHYFALLQPPLRSATTLKYLAGFETGGGDVINPLPAEDACAHLKSVML